MEPKDTPEPLNTHDTRTYKILNALSNYKSRLLQKHTLNTQNPDALINLDNIMNNANERIQGFLRTHSISDDDKKDQDYFECVSSIKEQLLPWTPDTIVLPAYWCEKVFYDSNTFSITPAHIERLYNNSISKEDGVL
jgi:hypothetical protein